MSARITYDLKHAIEIRTRDPKTGDEKIVETITQVTHPVGIRIKGRDIRACGGAANDEERTLLMIGHFCGLSRAAVDEMDGEDVAHLSGVVADFQSGLPTGTTA